MQALRWMFAVTMMICGFAASSVIAYWMGLDIEPALAIGGLIGVAIITPLTWWAPLASPPMVQPVPTPAEPANDPLPQIVVGDPPGEAVAWQERFEVMERLRVVASSGRTAVVCAVTGQRGIGKTQVAAAYARRCVAEGWPVVVWIEAETAGGVLAGLDSLADAAGIRPAGADPTDAASVALKWLRVQPGSCLVVFDNATDADLVRRWTAPVGNVQTIVTTTDSGFDALGMRIEVDLFGQDEAVSYLRQRTGLVDHDGAARVAEQLGRLPLALSQAGAVVGRHRRYTSYQSYLDRLDRLPIGELLPRVVGDPYPRGAAEAVLIGLDDLSVVDNGAARELLDHIAVLAPSGLDPVLLRCLTSLLDPQGQVDSDAVRASLAQRSLTTSTLDQDRVTVHRLIQRVARENRSQNGGVDKVLVTAATAVLQAARQIRLWEDRALLTEYGAHADTLWTYHPAAEDATRTQLLSLRAALAQMFHGVHNFTAAIATGESLATDCVRVLGSDHPTTLAVRNNLASVYENAGRPDEAITVHTSNLADAERLLGSDHPHTLTARNNLASAHEAAGHLDKAITLYIRNLTDRERVLGHDHPDTLGTRNNLASAHEAAGHLDKAITLYIRNLTDRERVLGHDHPDTLTARNNLGNAYRLAGQLDEAIIQHRRALADRERVFGPDHPDTLSSKNNIAITYHSAGRLGQAIDLHTDNLADNERILGPDHPYTLATRCNLAAAKEAAGQIDEAIVIYGQSVADAERVLGPNHPDTLIMWNNLASAHQAAGHLDKAIALQTRNLANAERVLGPDHPHTLLTRGNLAGSYRVAGRLDEAIALNTENVGSAERILGPDHPHTLTTRNNLAAAKEAAGHLDEAAALYGRIVADAERVLGPTHPDTIVMRNNLARAYRKQGKSEPPQPIE
jgi:tetratricopeptide (TPR) repeat protein